jgi:hypothetical protein
MSAFAAGLIDGEGRGPALAPTFGLGPIPFGVAVGAGLET